MKWLKRLYLSLFRDSPTIGRAYSVLNKFPSRPVSLITADMLREEILYDGRIRRTLDRFHEMDIEFFGYNSEVYKSSLASKKERNEFYASKHWNINVRLSIKQTKNRNNEF